jgi:S1-C subfamily serine protease
VGDVVIGLDGAPTPSIDAVHRLLTRDKIGQRVSLAVLRDGKITDVSMQVAERREDAWRD